MITIDGDVVVLIAMFLIIAFCAACWVAFTMGKEYEQRQQEIRERFQGRPAFPSQLEDLNDG